MVYNNPRSRWEKFSQEDYWLVDLMARYQITDKLSASVNVNNVFDKTYYTNIGFYTSASYGDPRNLMFQHSLGLLEPDCEKNAPQCGRSASATPRDPSPKTPVGTTPNDSCTETKSPPEGGL